MTISPVATAEPATAPPAPRPRFSLRALLLFTLFAGLVIGNATAWRELHRTRRELTLLRNQVGELDVQDPSRAHAIALDTGDPETWRWQIYVPPRNRYDCRIAEGIIPLKGLPASKSQLRAGGPAGPEGNRFTLTVGLAQTRTGLAAFS